MPLASSNAPIYFKSFGSLGPIKVLSFLKKDQVHYYRFFYIDGSLTMTTLMELSIEGFGSKVKSFFGFGGDSSTTKDPNFDIVLKNQSQSISLEPVVVILLPS